MIKKKEKSYRIILSRLFICEHPKSDDIYQCDCKNHYDPGYNCSLHPAYRVGIKREEAIEILKWADIELSNKCLRENRQPTNEERAAYLLDALIKGYYEFGSKDKTTL